ncbi:MAG: L-threonylcarbamoyladenylate synthase [Bryobacteraceae bacterium]
MVTEDELRRAAVYLRAGRLVAFPTETVYGLGANAMDAEAVGRIFAAKGRPATSPLIVHVDSVEMARGLVTAWPESADALASKFWPGPLTLILPKQPSIPGRVTAGLTTVGLRMPSHPVALALIRAAGIPLAAPSANRFTELSPTTARHVREALGNRVDMVLDGGPCTVGIESTVLSLAGGIPVLLRPGMITQEQIEDVIGPVSLPVPVPGAHQSPGMHPQHYRPKTLLLQGAPPSEGRGAYLYWNDPLPAARPVQMPSDPAAYAAVLYGILHNLDTEGWDYIAVEPVPHSVEWAGIRDRLRRAAA